MTRKYCGFLTIFRHNFKLSCQKCNILPKIRAHYHLINPLNKLKNPLNEHDLKFKKEIDVII